MDEVYPAKKPRLRVASGKENTKVHSFSMIYVSYFFLSFLFDFNLQIDISLVLCLTASTICSGNGLSGATQLEESLFAL